MRFVRALTPQKETGKTVHKLQRLENKQRTSSSDWRTSKEQAPAIGEQAKNMPQRMGRTSKEHAPESGKNEQRTVEELGLWVQSWWTS